MNHEVTWIENDLKVEMLALKMKRMRQEYLRRHPDAKDNQVESYVNRKLQGEAQGILREQFEIVSSAVSQ